MIISSLYLYLQQCYPELHPQVVGYGEDAEYEATISLPGVATWINITGNMIEISSPPRAQPGRQTRQCTTLDLQDPTSINQLERLIDGLCEYYVVPSSIKQRKPLKD